jgi:N-acetylglucosamine kinase-like BadF-type ATPase
LLGDVEIALDAAFRGGQGVLVLAGTGSNVVGRTAHGELVGAGGWGPALADQGSGHRIGQTALRAIFLAIDKGQLTSLYSAVLDHWKLRNREDLVAYANQLPSPDVSQLTATILRCANDGDEVALGVLRSEGEALGYLVRLVLRKLAAAQTSEAPLPSIAFAGSIMESVLPVRAALIATVHQEFPSTRALDGVVDPIDGALWRARRA